MQCLSVLMENIYPEKTVSESFVDSVKWMFLYLVVVRHMVRLPCSRQSLVETEGAELTYQFKGEGFSLNKKDWHVLFQR